MYATEKQIIAAAQQYVAIGRTWDSKLYAVNAEGEKVVFAVKLGRDSLHNLKVESKLKYNGDYTYSQI